MDHQCREDRDPWYIYPGLQLAWHRHQQHGEIDFLVMHPLGAVVIEVKGGLIEMRGGKFYRIPYSGTAEQAQPLYPDPQTQAKQNSHSFRDWTQKSGLKPQLWVTWAVILPDTQLPFKGPEHNGLHFADMRTDDYPDFMRQVLESTRAHYKANYSRKFMRLDERALENWHNAIKPTHGVDGHRLAAQRRFKTTRELQESQSQLLQGLEENHQIMMEGAPGTGKSTYARSFMERNAAEEGRRGLYLCWNDMLAAQMQADLRERDLDNKVQAFPFYYFIDQLTEAAGTERLRKGHQGRDDWDGDTELVRKLNQALAVLGKLPAEERPPALQIDFLVVDEAQDLFGKGLYEWTNALKTMHDVRKLSMLMLYDMEQLYTKKQNEIDDIRTYEDIFREESAHFRLMHNYRQQYHPEMQRLCAMLADEAFPGPGTFDNESVRIHRAPDMNSVKRQLGQLWKQRSQAQSPENEAPELPLLLYSTHGGTIRGAFEAYDVPVPYHIWQKGEPLPESKMIAATPRRAKGLEAKDVWMVTEEPWSSSRWQEAYLGATRAKIRIEWIVVG
mgnify:FL=1